MLRPVAVVGSALPAVCQSLAVQEERLVDERHIGRPTGTAGVVLQPGPERLGLAPGQSERVVHGDDPARAWFVLLLPLQLVAAGSSPTTP